ncbi:hypothetical protein BF95_05360 [Sphingobium sp. Ant17]|nr:hypothetical protein BF95_05360 [Sphingobium sp. Ant17]
MSAISADVGGVHTLLAGIADDNQAQSRAITEVSTAVGAMDQATQQNAAMVEQTSAAARNLTLEVTALSEQAAKFRIGGAPQRGVTPRQTRMRNEHPQNASRSLTTRATAMADVGARRDEFATF